MEYRPVKYDSILNKITKKDRLFLGDYTVDPYQNCEFGCKYCDSTYESTVYIKSNADEILEKELEQNQKGTVIIGSVHDPYQKAEEKYMLTRKILKVIKKHGFTCHILTKSDLVLRDIDLLKEIDSPLVTISMSSIEPSILKIFEENVPSPKIRFKTIEKLSENNIRTGLAIMPIFPLIFEENLEEIIKEAKEHNASYALFKHLELKGDQKIKFFETLEEKFPDLLEKYDELYKDSYMPKESYISNLNSKIKKISKKYEIKNEILNG